MNLLYFALAFLCMQDQFTVEISPSLFNVSVQEQPKQIVQPQKTGKRYLAMFTASYCGPCQTWKSTQKPKVESAGFTVREFEMTNAENREKYSDRISRFPTFVIIDWDTGEWIGDPIVGSMQAESFLPLLANKLEVPARKTVRAFSRKRLPVVQTPWGVQDLETYESRHIGCNCVMCVSIRAMIADMRRQMSEETYVVSSEPIKANFGQENTPDKIIEEMIDLLNLTSSDVLADLGCGDGRILIAAVKKTGCRAVGVEIDPAKASEARANAEKAGLSAKITIITGDVTVFRPEDYQVTAITAFLYPELLEKIGPAIYSVGKAATPYHNIPGLTMMRHGDVWIFNRK